MKYKKILRLLGVITVVTLLLMAVIPALPVMGETLTLSPAQGKVGDRITFSGAGYTIGTTLDYYMNVYITDQTVSSAIALDTGITRYKRLVWGNPIDAGGTFTGSFIVPDTLNEGTLGTTTPLVLAAGSTYTVFTSGFFTDPTLTPLNVRAWASFSVSQGAILDPLTPAAGAAGTAVTITGANFPASTALVFQFDTTPLTPTGDTVTRASGLFISTITVPANAAAGAHTITVTSGSSSKTATFTITAPSVLTLSPLTGAAGTPVAMSGANFPAGAISVTFDGAAMAITGGSTQTSGGAFASFITIPTTATAAAHTIVATVGTSTATATFTVTGTPPPTTTPPPTSVPPTTVPPTTTPPATGKAVLSINSSGHAVGATIGIGGAGFASGANVTIKYDTTVVSSVKAETNGTFISPFFTAPPSVHGDHVITATDGVNTATTKFTMESTAPKVPPPLKPELGAKAKSPVTFAWTNITDDSLPVTYRLQVATVNTFAASTLVLDKTGLTGSPYAMTQIEELKLAGTADTPYYWRIQSIDGASNESAWTGASVFYIPGPFKFPSWAIYVGGAVGALIFFLIGLFIGRRTAFMY